MEIIARFTAVDQFGRTHALTAVQYDSTSSMTPIGGRTHRVIGLKDVLMENGEPALRQGKGKYTYESIMGTLHLTSDDPEAA